MQKVISPSPRSFHPIPEKACVELLDSSRALMKGAPLVQCWWILLNTSAFQTPTNGLNGVVDPSNNTLGSLTSNTANLNSASQLGGLSNPSSNHANANVNGGHNQPQSLDALFSISDPMMLNDPLIGMLDWQAWQNYLAPYASNNPNGGTTGLNDNGAGGAVWGIR